MSRYGEIVLDDVEYTRDEIIEHFRIISGPYEGRKLRNRLPLTHEPRQEDTVKVTNVTAKRSTVTKVRKALQLDREAPVDGEVLRQHVPVMCDVIDRLLRVHVLGMDVTTSRGVVKLDTATWKYLVNELGKLDPGPPEPEKLRLFGARCPGCGRIFHSASSQADADGLYRHHHRQEHS